MSQHDAEAHTRFQRYLAALRQLKDISARRETAEKDILLSVLMANRDRLSEYPSLEAEQQNLVAALTLRADTLAAHARFREWLAAFLATLNQFEVASRTGDTTQTESLEKILTNQEVILVDCLQGSIFASGLFRDNFNDVILQRFGEPALADLDAITHSGETEERYWQSLLDRFVFGFMEEAYAKAILAEKHHIALEGPFLAIRLPMDAILGLMPGTTKTIGKTRLQENFVHVAEEPDGQRVAAFVAGLLQNLAQPILPQKSAKSDFDLLGQVTAMMPAAKHFMESAAAPASPAPAASDPQEEPQASEEPQPAEAQPEDADPVDPAIAKAFLRTQTVAVAVGAALALGNCREGLARSLRAFSQREQETLLALAGPFSHESLTVAYAVLLEYALNRLLADKCADEGGKVQVKCLRQRRAPRPVVERLGREGLNRVRQKLFFEPDPAGPEWFLFKAKNAKELADTLTLSNIEPKLAVEVTALWTRMEFKVEAAVLINLPLVARATTHVQAKVSEILSKFGVGKAAVSQGTGLTDLYMTSQNQYCVPLSGDRPTAWASSETTRRQRAMHTHRTLRHHAPGQRTLAPVPWACCASSWP